MIAGVGQRDGHRVEVLPEEQLKLGGRVSLSEPQQSVAVRQDEGQSFPGASPYASGGISARVLIALGEGGRGEGLKRIT